MTDSSGGATTTTPQRRSLYDLQLLIDEVFERAGSSEEDGSVKTCPVADLSRVLTAFENRRNLSLLTDDEKRSLEAFAEQVRSPCRALRRTEEAC